MTVWFTADTHFGHKNILEFTDRPGETVAEHDDFLISNWNSSVMRGDVVYHLGDFSFSNKQDDVETLIRRLNGQIHLIYGNHDRKGVAKAEGFVWKGDLKYIRIGQQKIMMCHYAMRVWRTSHRGSWMLYGHSHGTLPSYGLSYDVGVDVWNYHPVSFEDLTHFMSMRGIENADYHGKAEDDKTSKM